MEPKDKGGMNENSQRKAIVGNTFATGHNTHQLVEEMENLIELNKKVLQELEAIRNQTK